MKTHKKNIKYNPEQKEYILKIKGKCKWCWLLLLLLLPLILLIPLQKNIQFKVLNSYDQSTVSGLNVNFAYVKRDLFNFENYKFLTREYKYTDSAFFSDTTNSEGIITVKNVKYNVYQWLFRNKDTTRVFANDNCFNLDSISYLFKLKKENIIYVNPIMLDFEFTVVDADDNNEPLQNALVRIKSDILNISNSDSSDHAGKVIFKQIPKCSNIEVIGSKYGWFNDTIKGNAADIYQKKDTLFLKQEKTIIKFFVKDLYTKKPLVGAIGKLFFETKPNVQVGSATTNINGVAKGVFENIHKIKKMRIDASYRPHYNDSSTVNYYVTEKWKLRKDEDKVIYLRPNPNPILFKNIDCKTKVGLPNVINMVTITKSDGTITGPTKFVSDASGNFSLSLSMGDKITIIAESKASCPNEYIKNESSIKNVLYDVLKIDADKRKIPLCKKDAPQVKFKNIDKDTGSPLSGVTNKVKVNGGGSFTYTSKANGEFIVSDVYECEIISIESTKVGYKENNTTINGDTYNLLASGTINQRTIPLVPDLPPVPVNPCTGGALDNDDIKGGKGYSKVNYNMGQSSGTFIFEYFTDTAADRIKVSCNGKVLMDKTIATDTDWIKESLTFTNQIVTVEVFGNTEWEYRVNCP